MPAARIIKRRPREIGTPGSERLDEASRGERWAYEILKRRIPPQAVFGGANGKLGTARNEQSLGIDLHRLAIPLEFPGENGATRKAMPDAGPMQKILRPLWQPMLAHMIGRGDD